MYNNSLVLYSEYQFCNKKYLNEILSLPENLYEYNFIEFYSLIILGLLYVLISKYFITLPKQIKKNTITNKIKVKNFTNKTTNTIKNDKKSITGQYLSYNFLSLQT